MTRNQVAAGALVAFAGIVLWEARALSFGTLTSPGAGYLPIMLAAALMALALPVLVFGGDEDSFGARPGLWKALAVPACLAFVLFAMDTFGYRATIAIAVIFLLGTVEGRHPAAAFTSALLLSAGSHYLIERTLSVALPRGFWGF